jgi:hypothetical protein
MIVFVEALLKNTLGNFCGCKTGAKPLLFLTAALHSYASSLENADFFSISLQQINF